MYHEPVNACTADSPIAGGLLVPDLESVVAGPVYRSMMDHVESLHPGDIILSVDGRSVYNSKASDQMIKFADSASMLTLRVFDHFFQNLEKT